jgi:hypothetical protein
MKGLVYWEMKREIDAREWLMRCETETDRDRERWATWDKGG